MKIVDEKHKNQNIPEYEVSEIASSIKNIIENEFGQVRVRGELGRVFSARSGHLYYDIKDERSLLSAVTFKGQVSSLSIFPEEGIEVIATGKVTTFSGQSKYQLIVDELKVAGVGALMAMLEKRKYLLEKEGLFDNKNKKKIPYIPRLIGVITSPQGAVLSDILHRLRDRFPRNVIVWPVTVQGDFCADQVCKAIKGFNSISVKDNGDRPDVIIVARGGGSIEDLWSFNEEKVVREVASSKIPIISAIGHETDTTLIDYASDIRAPTPSAAAEIVVPVRELLLKDLNGLDNRLSNVGKNIYGFKREKVESLFRVLLRFESLLMLSKERLKYASKRLPNALIHLIQKRKTYSENVLSGFRVNLLNNTIKLAHIEARSKFHSFLNSMKSLINVNQNNFARQKARLNVSRLVEKNVLAHEKLDFLDKKLMIGIQAELKQKIDNLYYREKLLKALSYKKTLERGYTVVWVEEKIISSFNDLSKEDKLTVEFKDGKYIIPKSV
jgi:exodeoxyribonuclease VII large subunit